MSKRVKELRKLLEERPHDPALLQELAFALSKVNDHEGAAGAYAQLATEYERAGLMLKALATLKLAYGLDPANPSLVARIQLLQGDVLGAFEEVLKAEE